VEDILALNVDVDAELLQVGQVLLVPPDEPSFAAGSAAVPDDPNATPPDFVVHVVRSGEALLSIAEKYGVSVQTIRQANDLGPYEDTIQVNQSLVIPLARLAPSPTPTAQLDATPTAPSPYPAPRLLSPPDGATIETGNGPVLIQWASIGILDADEWYAATLSFSAGRAVSTTHYTRATSWRVPYELLTLGAAGDGAFVWRVQVVKEATSGEGSTAYAEAGVASQTRRFTWVGPTATPSPTPASGS
jgi:LysM repeat protein